MNVRMKRTGCGLACVVLFWIADTGLMQAQVELTSGVGRLSFRTRLQQFERNDTYLYPMDFGLFTGGGERNNAVRDLCNAAAIDQIYRFEDVNPRTRLMYHETRNDDADDPREFHLLQRYEEPIKLVTRLESPKPTLGSSFGIGGVIIDPNLETEQKVMGEWVSYDGQTWRHEHWMTANRNYDQACVTRMVVNYEGIQTEQGGASGQEIIRIPPGQVIRFWNGNHYQKDPGNAMLLGSTSAKRDDWLMHKFGPSRLLSPAEVPRAANLQIFYLQDGTDAATFKDWDGSILDHYGEPRIGPVFAKAQQYETGDFIDDVKIGYMVIHYDKSGADETDMFHLTDLTQSAPSSRFEVRRGYDNGSWGPFPGGKTKAWEAFTTPGFFPAPRYMTWTESVEKHFMELGVTEASVASVPSPSAARKGNDTRQYVLSGPAVISPGEVHDYVYVHGGASLPAKENVALGARYLRWVAQQHPGQHPNGDVPPISNLTPLSNLEKYQVLEAVADTLFTTFDNAFNAFHGGSNSGLTLQQKKMGEGFRRAGQSPKAPNIFLAEGPNRCDIRAWYGDDADFEDHYTGVDDLKGWRIYRKQGRPDERHPDELQNFGFRFWEVVGEVRHDGAFGPNGQPLSHVAPLGPDHYNAEWTFRNGETRRIVEFFDLNVSIGEDYWYAVTVFDDGNQNVNGAFPGESLESSRFRGFGVTFSQPTRAFTPGLTASNQVRIVPNPWTFDGGEARFSGADPNKIVFDRLPLSCKLIVFTETGDEVITIDHGPGTLGYLTGQEIWNQQTRSNQLAQSGVYILAITQAKDIDLATNEVKGNLPDYFEKFVIIR